jgi:hypothetical protein
MCATGATVQLDVSRTLGAPTRRRVVDQRRTVTQRGATVHALGSAAGLSWHDVADAGDEGARGDAAYRGGSARGWHCCDRVGESTVIVRAS